MQCLYVARNLSESEHSLIKGNGYEAQGISLLYAFVFVFGLHHVLSIIDLEHGPRSKYFPPLSK